MELRNQPNDCLFTMPWSCTCKAAMHLGKVTAMLACLPQRLVVALLSPENLHAKISHLRPQWVTDLQAGSKTDLAMVHNASVWMHKLDLPMSVHVVSLRRRIQPEPLAASQQNVEVVMEVMVQPTAGTCNHTNSPC